LTSLPQQLAESVHDGRDVIEGAINRAESNNLCARHSFQLFDQLGLNVTMKNLIKSENKDKNLRMEKFLTFVKKKLKISHFVPMIIFGSFSSSGFCS
jgi:hypothetical protein